MSEHMLILRQLRVSCLLVLAGAIACASQRASRERDAASQSAVTTASPSSSEPRQLSARSASAGSTSTDGASAGKASGPAPAPTTLDPFGKGYPPALPSSPEFGRVASKTWGSWIHPKPDSRSLPLGGIRIGDSVAALGPPVRSGLGECQAYVPVAHGFACADRRNTTDMTHPFIQASRWTQPAKGAFPYHYAFSLGAPMLTRIPTEKENRWSTGPRNHRRARGWEVGHDELTEQEPIAANGPIPDFLQHGGSAPNLWGKKPGLFFKKAPFGAMIAYTRAFEAEGEVWVLSTNMTIVPAKGLLRFRRSTFQGVELSADVKLPIAWARKQARPKYVLRGEVLEKTGDIWPARSWVGLSGAERKQGGERFLETTTSGVYVAASDVRVAEQRKKPPWEIKYSPNRKWVHAQVRRGTLTLYEGARPVFTTLMSTGKDGSTPYGRYWIESKHHVTTLTNEMGEPRKAWVADVPWTQYFKRPYAIHAAYWHEDFGEIKSAGCVNLSPTDAKRVFDWTEPTFVPEWGTVQGYGMGHGTFILVEG